MYLKSLFIGVICETFIERRIIIIRTIIIVIRRVEKGKALINAKNVDELKPYSAKQKFSGVLALTVRNTKYLSCKIVVGKRSLGCHVAGRSGSSNEITWRARASNNGV